MGPDLLEEYRKDVERIFGEDLVSLTLYGSHAGGEAAPGRDLSVLIVVRALRKEALEGYRAVARRYARGGIPAPPILTESFLRESADVFPLEFLGIAERRKVLAGTDVMAGLAIASRNLRHQVEFELKGKFLSLRRSYLESSGNREVAALVLRTVGPIVVVGRGLLLAEGRPAPHRKEEILDEIEKRFDVRLPVLREALAARRAGRLPPARAAEIWYDYLAEAELLCSLSDRFRTPEDR